MELYTLENNPRRHRRRHSRRYAHRRNPASGFARDFTELVKKGFFTTLGFAGAAAVGKVMPAEVKTNQYLSPIAKVIAAIAVISVRGSMPGGEEVADQVAAGAATAGVIEFALNVGGANLPGRPYLPTLGTGGGGRMGGGGMVRRPQLGTGAPPLFKSAAFSPDVVL